MVFSLHLTGPPRVSAHPDSPTLPSSAGAMSPSILCMPDYTCWLCRREIEVSAVCRVISFSPASSDSASVSLPGKRLARDNALVPTFVVPRDGGFPVTVTAPVYHGRVWTWRVHYDCWEMVTSQLPSQDPAEESACATTWSRAIAALNWNFCPFSACQTGRYDLPRLLLRSVPARKGFARRLGMHRPTSWESLARELEIPLLGGEMSMEELGISPPRLVDMARGKKQDDIFMMLPGEIVSRLVCLLSTPDLANLRLASRSVARLTHVHLLPIQFWASRFSGEFELAFAAPTVSPPADRDWLALYFKTRHAISKDRGRLAKRKYWWDRLAGVTQLCLQWRGVALAGEEFVWDTNIKRKDKGKQEVVLKQTTCVSARLTRDDDDDRNCLARCLPLTQSITAVGVSVVDLAGERHLCGLQIYEADTKGYHSKKGIGYILSESETVVDVPPGATVFGFRVRVDDDAVRAVKVISQTPEGRLHVSPWIGDMTTGDSMHEMPVTGVSVGGALGALVGSFDYFRMTAFGLAVVKSKNHC